MQFLRSPNQQDLSWFIDMKTQERLELDPPYQRRSVWTSKDKQFFLDTIFNNFPCPAVYLQKENSTKGPLYNVVDGKQRLSTVLDFYAGKIRIGPKFAIADLRGKKFQDLPEDRKSDFYNYIFMVEQIRSESTVDWGEVFQRVNKNQKKLQEQELRHARFDGWLIHRAEAEMDESGFWKDIGISSRSRKSRMKDVEFVSILMLVLLEKDFVGFPQFHIDELYAKYDFDLAELPDTEADIVFEDDDAPTPIITAVGVKEFEASFLEIRTKIAEMEAVNKCITLHKKRITADFYSLWTALALSDRVRELPAKLLATRLTEFLDGVYEAIELNRNAEDVSRFDKNVQLYSANSTGAATEVSYRQKRNEALTKFLLGS